MMSDSKITRNDGVRQVEDLWALREDTDQYRAWQCWLQFQIGTKFFGRWLTVTGEWPPLTQLAADHFAQWLSDIRDEVDKMKGIQKFGKPIPRHPEPWDGYIPAPKRAEEFEPINMEKVMEYYRKLGWEIDNLDGPRP